MAEPVVSFVLERLSHVLIQEIVFLEGVKEQFERLRSELRGIRAFLRDADAKQHQSEGIRSWVADVRDVAYDIDDIMDKFMLKVPSEGEKTRIYRGFIKFFGIPKTLVNLHKRGKEIEAICTRIEDINNRRTRYDLTTFADNEEAIGSSISNTMSLRRTYSHVRDDDVVGLEKETSALVVELKRADKKFRVISILGMGGSGKTTLAKHVYNHNDIKCHFESQAWTFVSQELRTKDVLKEILRKVSSLTSTQMEKMKEGELVKLVYGILESRLYLVVLDDIWSKEAWGILKSAFPNGKRGSKVLITTRDEEIAKHADPWTKRFIPPSLTNEEGWILLTKKAFPTDINGTSWSLSGDLEKCGKEMVNKCHGLPLAVVVLGGVLSTKQSPSEWKSVSKDINIYMREGHDGVFAVLALSYHNLPYYLKPLFLYLGLFPEDFHIPIKNVVQMWVAENMVRDDQDAKRYVDKFIQRCMVQIIERGLDGKAKTIQLHDRMRDFSIAKAKEENFFKLFGRKSSLSSDLSSTSLSLVLYNRKLRRCAIYLQDDNRNVGPELSDPSLRTVFFLRPDGSSINVLPRNLMPGYFKLLRVLYLQGIGLQLEEPLGTLFEQSINLRYLCLRNTGLRWIPESLYKLPSLEFLDLRGTHCGNKDLGRMRLLKHLYAEDFGASYLRLDTMRKLQTLSGINDGPWINTDLISLTYLKKLVVNQLSGVSTEMIFKCCLNLNNLRSLALCLQDHNDESFQGLDLLSGFTQLLKLKLKGQIENLPKQWPPNLIKLNLEGSQFKEDPMPVLESMQNLVYLYLYNSWKHQHWKQMVCSKKGFPRLQNLNLYHLAGFQEWRVEEAAMSSLTDLTICNCPDLKMIPEGLRFVTALKRLHIKKMPREFETRIKRVEKDSAITSINVEHDIRHTIREVFPEGTEGHSLLKTIGGPEDFQGGRNFTADSSHISTGPSQMKTKSNSRSKRYGHRSHPQGPNHYTPASPGAFEGLRFPPAAPPPSGFFRGGIYYVPAPAPPPSGYFRGGIYYPPARPGNFEGGPRQN